MESNKKGLMEKLEQVKLGKIKIEDIGLDMNITLNLT